MTAEDDLEVLEYNYLFLKDKYDEALETIEDLKKQILAEKEKCRNFYILGAGSSGQDHFEKEWNDYIDSSIKMKRG